jgi:hypothetical protein
MTPGLENGVLIGFSSIITMVIAKCRCFYKHGTEHPCACGFTDTPLQDDNEIHIKTAMVNGVELLYVGKIATEDDDEIHMKSRFCNYYESE